MGQSLSIPLPATSSSIAALTLVVKSREKAEEESSEDGEDDAADIVDGLPLLNGPWDPPCGPQVSLSCHRGDEENSREDGEDDEPRVVDGADVGDEDEGSIAFDVLWESIARPEDEEADDVYEPYGRRDDGQEEGPVVDPKHGGRGGDGVDGR